MDVAIMLEAEQTEDKVSEIAFRAFKGGKLVTPETIYVQFGRRRHEKE